MHVVIKLVYLNHGKPRSPSFGASEIGADTCCKINLGKGRPFFKRSNLMEADIRVRDWAGFTSWGSNTETRSSRRSVGPICRSVDCGQTPTTKEAQAIVDEIFSLFVSEEVDKVELLYTKFVSLIKSEPVIHTLLPLSPQVSLATLCIGGASQG